MSGMNGTTNWYLLIGAIMSAIAALAHVGVVFLGARGYRALGAGERMAKMAEQGRAYPAVVTLAVACILMACSIYALSGAQLVGRLPFLPVVLCGITAAYLLRAVAFLPLMKVFPENSPGFWWVSSAVCLVLGVTHLLGVLQGWGQL